MSVEGVWPENNPKPEDVVESTSQTTFPQTGGVGVWDLMRPLGGAGVIQHYGVTSHGGGGSGQTNLIINEEGRIVPATILDDGTIVETSKCIIGPNGRLMLKPADYEEPVVEIEPLDLTVPSHALADKVNRLLDDRSLWKYDQRNRLIYSEKHLLTLEDSGSIRFMKKKSRIMSLIDRFYDSKKDRSIATWYELEYVFHIWGGFVPENYGRQLWEKMKEVIEAVKLKSEQDELKARDAAREAEIAAYNKKIRG